jgi:hypothetical protein
MNPDDTTAVDPRHVTDRAELDRQICRYACLAAMMLNDIVSDVEIDMIDRVSAFEALVRMAREDLTAP